MAIISKGPQKKIKLDLYDKKLIFYLSQNSREPTSSLARKLNISPQRTTYKIEQLKKELLEPALFLNFPVLNIKSYLIYLKTCSEENIKKITTNNSIYFLMQNIGAHEWIINVVTNDIELFLKENLKEELFEIEEIIKAIPDKFNPFQLNIKENPLQPTIQMNLNQLDYKLIDALAKNPLASSTTLSNITKIDRATIRKKIQKYSKTNLIQKFRYSINIFKLGHIAYILRIKTTPETKDKTQAFLRENDYSGFIFQTLNAFTMHYLPPSHNELIDFIERIRSFNPKAEIETLQNTEFFKVDLVPQSVNIILQERINN